MRVKSKATPATPEPVTPVPVPAANTKPSRFASKHGFVYSEEEWGTHRDVVREAIESEVLDWEVNPDEPMTDEKLEQLKEAMRLRVRQGHPGMERARQRVEKKVAALMMAHWEEEPGGSA